MITDINNLSVEDIVRSLRCRMANHIPNPDWSKRTFLEKLPDSGKLLDVGCGNNSPIFTKEIKPNWYYIGLDIGDYNQTADNVADLYILTEPQFFTNEICKYENELDCVISSHNLEHCEDRFGTLTAMARALKLGGRMYLSFPCYDSVNFPGPRAGCLNFFDDCTHKSQPPNFGQVISTLCKENLNIIYATTRYTPPLSWVTGLFNENESKSLGRTLVGTWELYGFETIIWEEKCSNSK